VNGEVSETTSNKVEQSSANEDGMQNLINELKIELNIKRNSYIAKKNIK